MAEIGRQAWFPKFAEGSLWKIRLSPHRAAYERGSDLTLSANSGHPSVCIKGQVKTDCRHTAFRSACSKPVTQVYRLLAAI